MKHYTNFPDLGKSRVKSCIFAVLLCLALQVKVSAQQSLLPCNSTAPTPVISGTFSNLGVTNSTSGVGAVYWENNSSCNILGLPLGCGSTNVVGNVINSNTADFARTNLALGLGLSSTLRVTESVNEYSAGNFAGFLIRSSSVVSASVLGSITVRTYNNGTIAETSSASSLLGINSTLLTGSTEVGFYTTLPFDAVEITFNSLVGVAAQYDVFYAIMRGYCDGPALVCNTPTAINNNTFPTIVNPIHTGGGGLSVSYVENQNNAVSASTTDYANLVNVAGVLGSVSLAVKDQKKNYPAGTYAGFDIENTSILGVNLLGNITISTYLDGNTTAQETFSGSNLLSIPTSLLSSGGRQKVGYITTKEFDEVRITVAQVVGVNLGATRVYGAVLETFCAGTIACDNTYLLTQPAFPVLINSANTGITGAVCAGCSITDPSNVVTSSNSDYSRVTVGIGAASTASISVQNPIDTYPIGTIAGFIVRPVNSIAQVDLLNSITISTYNNGVFQESKAGSSLLNLELLGAITVGTGTPANVSFVTTKTFDEIKISFSSLVGVLNANDVYGAFVDTRSVADGSVLGCGIIKNPDLNVTQVNVQTSGNVSTNDKVPAGTTYGPATPGGSNPVGGTLALNPNGTYTFTGTSTGVYTYQVPACAPTFACTSVPLVITVTDPSKSTNPPVVNSDIVAVAGSATAPGSVTVNVRANDAAGNTGGTLGIPTPSTPAHGTVSVVNGNIVYTPTAGYYGSDVFTYSVCESPSTLCATSTVYVTVKQPSAGNKTYASDDYVTTASGVTATGNVSTNDTDPEGNTLSVTAQSVSNSAGALTLSTNGSFTFVPASGFSGPTSFPYTTCDNGTPSACTSATLYILVNPGRVLTTPDFNVTQINVAVPGSLKTNDIVPTGTTYGPATPGVGNPTGATLTLNNDGTYSFTATTVGVYSYTVPVCIPTVTPCGSTPLVITVNDPTKNTNPPIANTDVAAITGAASNPGSVTINVKANDGVGNKGGVLGDPVPTTPAHGTVAVVNGNIVYTPTAGYYGEDVFSYNLCETPSGVCATATVHVTIKQPGSTNSTLPADDFAKTVANTTVTGNVSTNDTDPEGNTLTVTPLSVSNSKGALTLLADGSYTFIPATGFTGPVEFAYTTCDNGNPSACGSATLYLVVNAENPLPVTLSHFSVAKEGSTAQLKWSTTMETNSDRFEIERSQNGKTWNLIGTQKSASESNALKNYSFSDNNPLSGENLYRLKMIDRDATFAYSRIESLSFAGDLIASFYPNPVADKLIVKTSNIENVKAIKIINAAGTTVYQSSASISSEINVQNLAPGLYLVQMINKNGSVVTQKVIKQ